MPKYEYEAELIGVRRVLIEAPTRAKADSIFLNEEYDKRMSVDKVQVDHVIEVRELREL